MIMLNSYWLNLDINWGCIKKLNIDQNPVESDIKVRWWWDRGRSVVGDDGEVEVCEACENTWLQGGHIYQHALSPSGSSQHTDV